MAIHLVLLGTKLQIPTQLPPEALSQGPTLFLLVDFV